MNCPRCGVEMPKVVLKRPLQIGGDFYAGETERVEVAVAPCSCGWPAPPVEAEGLSFFEQIRNPQPGITPVENRP